MIVNLSPGQAGALIDMSALTLTVWVGHATVILSIISLTGGVMNKKSSKLALVMLVITLLVALPLFSGCGDEDKDEGPEGKEVTIGIMLDFSGPAGDQGRRNSRLWKDMIEYTNLYDPIVDAQGNKITLKVVEFDNEYDPGKTMIGYTGFLDQGVDLLVCSYPQDGEILKDRLAEDKIPMYIGGPSITCLEPPGYIFSMASPSRNQVEFFLKWLSTEEWDYQTMGRKPKVGAFGWDMTVSWERVDWAEAWVGDHPDEFEWIGSEIAAYGTTNWLREAERLKDADYLIVGTVGPGVSTFVNQARTLGFEGVFVVDWPQVAFWDTYVEACTPESLEGSIFGSNSPFYWEDSPTSENIRTVLGAVDPEMIPDTLNVVVNSVRIPIECVRAAAQAVGAENVDGEAIYQASLNIKFPLELLGHPEGGGFGTDRPEHLQRDCRPSTKVYRYNPEAEYDWDILSGWIRFPQWEGITV